MKEKALKIKNIFGEEIEVIPKLFLYCVSDIMGEQMTIPGIDLYIREEGSLMPYATLTKSFGEFIGMKNSAYIDTNNCIFAPQLLTMGFVRDTGFTKRSGFCSYPLWEFEESFLKKIGGEDYKRYSHEYDEYMCGFEEDSDCE